MIAVGDALPELPIVTTSGHDNLSCWRGQWLVLYFYPRDHTSGCTTEAENFRDHYAAFQSLGVAVVGVSRDTLASHRRFESALSLPFPLIADTDETLCMAFGVMKNKVMYGKPVRGIERTTCIFNAEGCLVHIGRGVKVPGHVDEVLTYLRSTMQ